MATAEEHKNRMTQAEREQKMTWQEIRDDSISKLEQSKIQLISANNTSQIKHTIKIIITLKLMIGQKDI